MRSTFADEMSTQKKAATIVLPFCGLALLFTIFEWFYGRKFGDHSSQKIVFGTFFVVSTVFGILAFNRSRYFRSFIIANGIVILGFLSLWTLERVMNFSGWAMISYLFIFAISIPIIFATCALAFRTGQSDDQAAKKSASSSPNPQRVD